MKKQTGSRRASVIKVGLLARMMLFGLAACSASASVVLEDGYPLYLQACELQDRLGVSTNDALRSELNDFLNTGIGPGTGVVALVQQLQPVFSKIEQAARAPDWTPPDVRSVTAETGFPSTQPWMQLNRAATVRAIQLLHEGKPEESLSFLAAFNDIGMKYARSGTIIQTLLYIASRTMQRPVLAAAIDALPVDSLPAAYADARRQYAQIPSMATCMIGERAMAVNTAKGMFRSLKQDEGLIALRRKMIKALEQQGLDEQARRRIDSGEALGIAQWEAQMLGDVDRVLAVMLEGLTNGPSHQLPSLDERVEKAVAATAGELDWDDIQEGWESLATNFLSQSFSMADAERFHRQIGQALSHAYLSLCLPASSGIGLGYRDFIAAERLMLVRLAARLHAQQHGSPPSSLQQLVDEQWLEAEQIVDPLSDKPFLLRSGSDFEAYSVGRDLQDDQGKPWDYRAKTGDTILIPLKSLWNAEATSRRR